MKMNSKTKDIKTHELLAGKYRVEGRIATGGMGKIYSALQGDLNRRVAVKIIDMNQWSPDMQARFEREMKTLIDLQVPNVITIYDYDQFRGHDFYVMPLLQGGTLSQRIRLCMQEKRLFPALGEVNQRLQLLAQALHRVHQKGIIHRDIKPSNIMFDGHGQPFIIDFGIARAPNPDIDITRSTNPIGTWQYMCLAHLNAQKPTAAFDIYALAVVIYQVLNGTFPYKSQEEVYNDYIPSEYILDLTTPDAEFQNWRSDLPQSLKRVFHKAMSQDVTKQYPDMMAFASDFAVETASLSGEDTGFFTFPVPQAPIDINDLPSTMHPRPDIVADATTLRDAESPRIMSRGRLGWLVVGITFLSVFAIVVLTLRPQSSLPLTQVTSTSTSTVVAILSTNSAVPSPLDSQIQPTNNIPLVVASSTVIPATSTFSPTITLTSTPTSCDVLLSSGLLEVEQWKKSGCIQVFAREDSELGTMVLVPCLVSDADCKPIWVNKYEITRGQQGDLDTDINLPWTNVGPSRANNWCQDRQGRLLTVQEWQNASGAAMGLIFPWGADPRDDYPPAGKAYDAKTYLADESWSGVIGMGGNVAEWVQDKQRIGSHFRSTDKFHINTPPEGLSNPNGDSTVGIRCGQDWSPKTN